MSTIFHFATLPVNATFGLGLADRPIPVLTATTFLTKPKGYDSLDQAYECGRTAAIESGEPVLAPDHYSDAEAAAFDAGAAEGARTVADWSNDEVDAIAEERAWFDSYMAGYAC